MQSYDGPVDNPALDIVALRRHQPVEAGVEVTGTVRVPRVELTSNPPVPDGEKLSWLVLGRGLDNASGADAATLAAAAGALFGGQGKPPTSRIAERLSLDDISIRSAGSGSSAGGGLGGQVISFGKRLSDRLSVAYQQGLTAASNALRIEYAVNRRVTVRAEAGDDSSIGIYYRRLFRD